MIKSIVSIISIVKQLNYILSKKQKREGAFVFLCIVIGSGLELLSISVVYPFLQMLTNTEMLKEKWYIQLICRFFVIKNENVILLMLALAIILVYLLKNALLIAIAYVQSDFSAKIYQELSTKMLESYLKRPYSFFINTNSSLMLRGISIDINGVYNIISNLFVLFSEVLTVAILAIYLAFIDCLMLIMALSIALICMSAIILGFKGKLKRAGEDIRKAAAEKNQYAYQAINGIKEIMVLNRTEQFVARYKDAALLEQKAVCNSSFFSACPDRVLEGICISGFIGIICIRIATGVELNTFVPTIGTFAMAAFRMLPSISKISTRINNLFFYQQHLQDTYYNIKEVNDHEEKVTKYIANKQIGVDINPREIHFDKYINLKNINFRYENSYQNVLSNLSICIKKGDAIALIGASGAGKTTLAEVVLGLLKPQEGTVELDGVDISAIPKQWSKIIGYVPQGVFLIDDTIRCNVAFGLKKHDISDEKVWEALRKAQLKDFVEKLPEGLDTIVGECGVKFSGGQRQRIAIARALYENPDILVLDEATSALDNETEMAVMESIDALRGSKTLIIVAHRLTTIRNCDIVYEIKDGIAIEKNKNEIFG